MSDLLHDRKKVEELQYYQILNLTRSEVNDTKESKEKVITKWKFIIRTAHPDKPGGDAELTKRLNAAKVNLTNQTKRQAYNDALDKFQLTDGQRRNPNFDQTMRNAEAHGRKVSIKRNSAGDGFDIVEEDEPHVYGG